MMKFKIKENIYKIHIFAYCYDKIILIFKKIKKFMCKIFSSDNNSSTNTHTQTNTHTCTHTTLPHTSRTHTHMQHAHIVHVELNIYFWGSHSYDPKRQVLINAK